VEVQPDLQGLVAIFGGFAVEGLIKIRFFWEERILT
jgi:hypothetical protein